MYIMHQEPPCSKGSNQEMVDSGVIDGVPDATAIESCNLKHGTSRTKKSLHYAFISNHHILQGSNPGEGG